MPSKNAPKKDNLNRNQRRNINREKAREQARLLKEKEEAKRKRTRIIAETTAVAIILAVIALVVVLVKNADETVPASKGNDGLVHGEKIISTQAPANVTEYGGISLGKELKAGTANKGATQVDIYFDYACGYCNLLGNEYGTALGEAAKRGDITLVYHPIVLHANNPFANTGAAAEFFVAENEPDKYFAFHELLHKEVMTPYLNNEGADIPQVQSIIDVAREAGISKDNCTKLAEELTPIEKAINDGTQPTSIPLLTWVTEVSNQFFKDYEAQTGEKGGGTPAVYIDGEKTDKWSDDIPDLLNK